MIWINASDGNRRYFNGMKLDLIERYSKPVPRYTSYPTAPHFHNGVTARTYENWLANLKNDAPISIYIHIPFCDRLCWYCGCNTKVVNRYGPIESYVAALEDEISRVAGRLPGRFKVGHIHWGGGTPTVLTEADFARITDRIARHFDIVSNAEIAIEIDPRTFSRSKAGTLAACGITRASLGVQDFTPRVQKAINRIQPFGTVESTVNQLRQAGIPAINFDLMYGLPLQSTDDVRRTIDLSAELTPDRFALFGYAHVPWMKAHQKLIKEEDLPDSRERMLQAEAAAAQMTKHGYVSIGLDHFAHPSDPIVTAQKTQTLHRNFQGYTTDGAEVLLGFGASAIGRLPQGYVQNAPHVPAYKDAMQSGALAVVTGIATDKDDKLRQEIIERLMCFGEAALSEIAMRHGPQKICFGKERCRLHKFERDGLVNISGDIVRITEEGWPFVRAIAATFDKYLSTGAGRHSRPV